MIDFTPGFNLGITHALAGLGGATQELNNPSTYTNTGSTAAGTTNLGSGLVDAAGRALDSFGNVINSVGNTLAGQQDASSGSYGTTSSNGTSPQEAAAYQAQLNDLNSLLGRTQTGLNQGLQGLNTSYQSGLNQQKGQEAQALQDYSDQRVATNKDKLGAYDTINNNANNGYRSLAQIIGRSAGTGSSAFQDLLPEVVGKDISAKRSDANTTYASNLGNIDTAQKKTENSFSQILQDLANQRNAQEQSLRTGVEDQRQSILQQEQQASANLAAAQGGNPVTAAAQYQPQIESSRNAVENFFNQFKPSVTPQQAAVAAPNLAGYQVDRSNVNANAQGVSDPSNPYADILRKKLQDQATV